MLMSAIAATGLSWWKPIVNAFVLMFMSIPTMVMLYTELQRLVYLTDSITRKSEFLVDK